METARMSVLANCFTMFAIFQFCHNNVSVFIVGFMPHLDNSWFPARVPIQTTVLRFIAKSVWIVFIIVPTQFECTVCYIRY